MNWDETKKIQQVGLRVEEFNRLKISRVVKSHEAFREIS
jgi:hypothetical protein